MKHTCTECGAELNNVEDAVILGVVECPECGADIYKQVVG